MAQPTQVFLSHPSALRVELRLDESRLILWWSPLAGISADGADRNFSNRDDHLTVFESIVLPDLRLADFQDCDYDPYRATLRFGGHDVTLELGAEAPVVLVSATRALTVEFKTGRYDAEVACSSSGWTVRHAEPGRDFEFAVALGPGAGAFRSPRLHGPGRARYGWADLAPGQTLAIGVGLGRDTAAAPTAALAAQPRERTRAAVESRLSADLRPGTPEFADARFDRLYAQTRRSLHAAIDDSGAVRASLKPIYYLIWLRDGAFCFNYQAATGWLHRHADWCRFVLANPTTLDEPGLPPGRIFAQLVDRTYGKIEEDGLYYAVWSVFTQTIQGGRDPLTPDDHATVADALAWLEAYAFDAERGLFYSRFADETPVRLSRDHGIDAAIGARSPEPGLSLDGRLVARSYDTYLNTLLHGVYSMLAALPGTPPERAVSSRAKAARLWRNLAPFFSAPGRLPPYGELLLESGERVIAPPYKPIRSVYVWAYSLPGLAPIPRIDAIRLALLRDVMSAPRLHWINGIAALVASVDPLTCPADELHAALVELAGQAERPGAHLPMGGTMPEKFDAPDGSLHDDIRPQAFAQSAFLAACASLGIRRLPFGLAVRPTSFIRAWRAYAWRDSEVDFDFGGEHEGLQIDGMAVPHSLQLPDGHLHQGVVRVSVGRLPTRGALVRSNVALHAVVPDASGCAFIFTAHGASELVFNRRPELLHLEPDCLVTWTEESGLTFARFEAAGKITARCRYS